MSWLTADGTWTTYTEADALADNQVWAIAIGAMEDKWLAISGGVSRFVANGTRTIYTTADGLVVKRITL